MKEKVISFFKNEYIAVQNVTREIAELSRDLVWDSGIHPKDAIHVASAVAADVSIFETYDGPLLRKGNKATKIQFREPPPRGQPNLPLSGGIGRAPRKLTIRSKASKSGKAPKTP